MCWAFLQPANKMQIHRIFGCICNFYDFTTPISSKGCSTYYRLAVSLRGSFEIPNFVGYRRSVRGLGFVPIESPPTTSQYLSIQSFTLSATVCPEFQCQIIVPQFEPPIQGGGGSYGGPRWSKMISIEMSYPHSYLTCNTLLACLAPFGHNTQHSGQTDGDVVWPDQSGSLFW